MDVMTVGELVAMLQDLEDQNLQVLIPSDWHSEGYATPLFVDVVGGDTVVIDVR